MTAKILTQNRLKEVLHYNPDTGVFTWRMSRGSAKAGSVAGKVHVSGYIHIQIDTRMYSAHRLAFLYMEGAFPPHSVDHENHIRSDNAWSNIRHATSTDNSRNKAMQRDNTSGVMGVTWHKRMKKWYVRIGMNNRNVYGGYFIDKQEAISKRKALDLEHGFHKNHGREVHHR